MQKSKSTYVLASYFCISTKSVSKYKYVILDIYVFEYLRQRLLGYANVKVDFHCISKKILQVDFHCISKKILMYIQKVYMLISVDVSLNMYI